MTELACIDLKQRFGKRYRIKRHEAATPQSTDPWHWIIPCKYGEIYPHGREYLAVMVTSITVAYRIRCEFPELEIIQDADDAVCFKFHVDHFKKIAKRVHAKTKRRMTPEMQKQVSDLAKANLKKLNVHPLNELSASSDDTSPSDPTQVSSKSEIVQK